MPFHILISQWFSLGTGGLEAWKVAKDVVLLGLTLFGICLAWQQGRNRGVFNILVLLAVLYGLTHLLLWAFHPELFQRSAVVGLIYNNRLPCFLLLGYSAAILNPTMFALRSIFKVVIGVSTVVALLGVLQFVLPKDILTHLGYSLERGVRPAFFIDDNASLPRIMSTLREPNALGAYLLVPITALTAVLLRNRVPARRMVLGGLLLLHGLALLLTFSRSAWLAAMVCGVLIVWWQQKEWIVTFVKRRWIYIPVVLTALAIVGWLVKDTSFVQHYITHSTEEQVVDLDSNDYHKLLVQQGLQGVYEQPLGHGPGTAGLASIQNPAGGQLTENYYVQIAYEVGLLGLAIFITVHVVAYRSLRKRKDIYGRILLATFWGYVVTNMLLHTWSNEAVAATWWLLAGAATGLTIKDKVSASPSP